MHVEIAVASEKKSRAQKSVGPSPQLQVVDQPLVDDFMKHLVEIATKLGLPEMPVVVEVPIIIESGQGNRYETFLTHGGIGVDCSAWSK